MQLTKITDINLTDFLPLLPPEGLSGGREALGVIGDDDRPCASVVANLLENEITVEWLFVHPDYRRKGIGSHLLRAVEVFGREKAEAIRVSFPEYLEDCRDFLFWEGYFLTKGDTVLKVSLQDDFKTDEYQKLLDAKPKKKTVCLKDLPKKVIPALQNFLRKDMGSDLYLFDCTPMYSYCIGNEKGEFEGCLLVEQLEEGFFQPVLLLNNGSNINTLELLKRFLQDIKEKCPKKVYLQFVTPNPSILRFVKNMAKDPDTLEHYEIKCAVKALAA